MQDSYLGLWNRSPSFLELGPRFLSCHVSVGNFDDHENGLCGQLGNSLSEDVQEVLRTCYAIVT